jgi:hypothetical protein
VFLNTLSASVLDAVGARAGTERPSFARPTPDDTLPTPGDSWDVTNRFAAHNGDPLPDQPLFGDSKQDRKPIAATVTGLDTAGYGSAVIDHVLQSLRGLPAPEGRQLAAQVRALGGSEHQRIIWLSHELVSLHHGALEPLGLQADAIRAHVLTTLADLTPTERATFFTNAAEFFANPGLQRHALVTYLTTTPGRHTSAINTAEALLILSQPTSDRGGVIATLTATRNSESAGGSRAGIQPPQVDTLVQTALQTGTPISLTDLGERSVVPD